VSWWSAVRISRVSIVSFVAVEHYYCFTEEISNTFTTYEDVKLVRYNLRRSHPHHILNSLLIKNVHVWVSHNGDYWERCDVIQFGIVLPRFQKNMPQISELVSALKMKEVCFSETLVIMYQIISHYVTRTARFLNRFVYVICNLSPIFRIPSPMTK
jgi:hypothetical protein